MSHEAQMNFVRSVKAISPGHFRGRRVLECGSLDVNGSVRDLFEGCDYTGADVCDGKGVDLVASAEDACGTGPYDVVISCEMLEHDGRWPDSVRAMSDAVKPGGLLVLTCAGLGREPHGLQGHVHGKLDRWATRHYRNLMGMDLVSRIDETQYAYWNLSYNMDSQDLYFWGIKRVV